MYKNQKYLSIDYAAASRWIFPVSSSYPPRDYQIRLCEQALFMNTLVCLPTGLGKTLIAAVVMYNYYKWFPEGQVVFLAPTKPLVDQQISACYDIVGISSNDTVQLSGNIPAEDRGKYWSEKRIFFSTPQTVVNDIKNSLCDPMRIVCLVMDEAHKATMNYAFTIAVELISSFNTNFRILALSATPGTDAKEIQNVIRHLRISNVQIIGEDDKELAPYRHERLIETIICNGDLQSGSKSTKEHINSLIKIPLTALNHHSIVDCTIPSNLNIYVLQDAEKKLNYDTENDIIPLDVSIEMNDLLSEVKSLVKCRKIYSEDGEENLLKALLELQKTNNILPRGSALLSPQYMRLIETLQSSRRKGSKATFKTQSKLEHLNAVLSEHFHRHGKVASSTRALIFCNTRDTVADIVREISKAKYISAHAFIGQSSRKSSSTSEDPGVQSTRRGLKQSEQISVLKSFNEGSINVLVATSVAEEGLDISEVDLIVFFDVVLSPIRQVQRAGRTGRKRSGRVVVLALNKAEADKIDKANEQSENIAKTLKNASTSLKLCQENPRMLPIDLPTPVIEKKDLSPKFNDTKVTSSNIPSTKGSSKCTNSISSYFQSKSDTNTRYLGTTNDDYSRYNLYGFEAKSTNTFSKGSIQSYLPTNTSVYSNQTTTSESSSSSGSTTSKSSTFRKDPSFEVMSSKPSNESLGIKDLFGWNFKQQPQKNLSLSPDNIKHHEDITKSVSFSNKSSGRLDTSDGPSLEYKAIDDINWFDEMKLSSNMPDWSYSVDDCDEVSVLDQLDHGKRINNHSYDSHSASTSDSKTKSVSIETPPINIYSPKLNDINVSANSFPKSESLGFKIIASTIRGNRKFGPDSSSSSDEHDDDKYIRSSPPKHTSGLNVKNNPQIPFVHEIFDSDEEFDPPQFKSLHSTTSNHQHEVKENDFDDGVPIETPTSEDGQHQDDSECAICMVRESFDNDPIIFCDGSCGTVVHLDCYGLKEVPKGNFYCEPCEEEVIALQNNFIRPKPPRCILCFQAGNLLRRSLCGKWVHSLCVLYTPELQLDSVTMRAENLGDLNPERKDLVCSICNRRGGACVQCEFDRCFDAFHPFCCYQNRTQMIIRVAPNGSNVYEIYCRKHKNNIRHVGRVVSSRNALDSKIRQRHKKSRNKQSRPPRHNLTDSISPDTRHLLEDTMDDVLFDNSEHSIVVTTRKRLHKTSGGKVSKEQRSKSLKGKKYADPEVIKYFDNEAVEVNSYDSQESGKSWKRCRKQDERKEADDEDDDEEDDDAVLSGDFINDGMYTQHEVSGVLSQQAMYLDLNRRQMELDSPEVEIHHQWVQPSSTVSEHNIDSSVIGGDSVNGSSDFADNSFISNSEITSPLPFIPPRKAMYPREDGIAMMTKNCVMKSSRTVNFPHIMGGNLKSRYAFGIDAEDSEDD